MTITVTIDGKPHAAHEPFKGGPVVHVNVPCPACKREPPLLVSGWRSHRGHDTVTARAVARCCDTDIGTIAVKMSTIFGLEEDERVTAGPWRVY